MHLAPTGKRVTTTRPQCCPPASNCDPLDIMTSFQCILPVQCSAATGVQCSAANGAVD